MHYEKAQVRAAAVMLFPLLATLVALFLMPVLLVAYMSLTNWSMTNPSRNFVGLKNFAYVFSDQRFWKSLATTIAFTTSKLILDTTISLAIAAALDRSLPLRKVFRIAHFAPVVVPITASSLIWLWFYDPGIGPFNQVLAALGLRASKWLYGEGTALFSLVLFSLWKGLGYNVIIFLAGLQGIPNAFLEAARVDGANELQIFFKIKLPLLAPIFSFVVMMGVINCFKVFTEANIMTPDGGPLDSTLLLVSYIYDLSFTRGKMGRGAAAALILFAIILAFTLAQRALGRKDVQYE